MISLISNYLEAKSMLDHYKIKERELRIELVDEFFKDQSDGTRKAEIDSCTIKAKFGTNYNLSQKAVDEVYSSLSDEELECINFKPTLIMSTYKKLTPELREALDSCITTSAALPSIEVIVENGD